MLIRSVTADTANGRSIVGRYLFANGHWQRNRDNYETNCWLLARGVPKAEVPLYVGTAVSNSWKLGRIPFAPEEPGGRILNLDTPQHSVRPADQCGPHAHWDMILGHSFRDLDDALKDNAWAKRTGIKTGAKYGLAWSATIFQRPFDQLPYLFFFGDQNVGKSIYHEALSLLMTKGVVSADRALTSNFTGELEGAVLAYIEEKDIGRDRDAYDRLKSLVTGQTIPIRRMGVDQYEVPNTLHLVQCANSRDSCPIDGDDTRITAIHVHPFQKEIPKPVLLSRLREEAPNFLRTLLDFPLPEPEGRLRLPPIATASKAKIIEDRVSELAMAIAEAMQPRESWHGVAKDLPELLGEGQWPTDARKVRRDLTAASKYLSKRGVSVSFGDRTNSGRALLITRT
jgi:hypothetical protein